MVESIQAVQRDIMGTMQKLVKRMEKLEAAATQQRFPTMQRMGGSMSPGCGRGRQWSPGSLGTMLVGVPLTLINRGWPTRIRSGNLMYLMCHM